MMMIIITIITTTFIIITLFILYFILQSLQAADDNNTGHDRELYAGWDHINTPYGMLTEIGLKQLQDIGFVLR
jgi:ABC-type antimicrobial peptide transport system permease subunit